MDSFVADVRYALRLLLKTPTYTAVAVATLALGIGANAAIFSVIDGVMLRPLPYPEINRIVVINEQVRDGQRMSVSWPNFQDWKAQNSVFESLGIYRGATLNLTGGDQPERLNGSMVSSDTLRTMGIEPMRGRAFSRAEDERGAPRVVIVSERLWRTRFGADPGLVGREITLNGESHTVVGIMPRAMRFPSRLTDVWVPLGLVVDRLPTSRGTHPGLTAVGKTKPGVTFDQARAELETIAQRLADQYPQSNSNVTVSMIEYYELVVANIRPALTILMGAVGFVMLIACANLANLMLARAEGRQREIAIRSALGAGRGRVVRQLLTESILLAAAGGLLGALLAHWGVQAFVASQPTSVPRIDLIAVDVRVLTFVAALSILTGVLFGLAPALRASSPDLLVALKEGSRGTGSSARRLRGALIVAEVALAIVLLVGAGLTIRSFSQLMAVEPGFNPEGVVTMRLTLPDAKYPDRARWTAFHQELVRRVVTLPGVEAAGINSAVPLEGGGSEAPVIVEGQPMPTHDRPAPTCLFQTTSPDYFRAMQIHVLSGRVFTDQDSESSLPVVVVDESLAERLFKGQEAVGKRIAFELQGGHSDDPSVARPLWREVIGVVRHVKHYGLVNEPPFVQLYAPFRQLPTYMHERRPAMALVVRTAIEPDAIASALRREVAGIDRDIPVYGLQTMRAYVAQTTEQPRMNMMLLGLFGGLALMLAVVGIYGVLSYTVTERTREIGIRMALGATRSDVLRLIVGQGMALTLAGVVIGIAASLAIVRFLRTMLFGVSPYDPATFAAIAALLSAVALVAAFVPGRRASNVNPIEALRYE